MATVQVGLVYYQDDPDKAVFRMVFQTDADAADVLTNGGPTDSSGARMLDASGTPYTWLNFGTDPARTAVMDIVQPDDPRVAAGMTGTP